MVPWEGEGYKPIGYGVDSITASINTMQHIRAETTGMEESAALKRRQTILKEIDAKGIIATPANSYPNELVTEAARLSILNDGIPVEIIYEENPHIQIKQF